MAGKDLSSVRKEAFESGVSMLVGTICRVRARLELTDRYIL